MNEARANAADATKAEDSNSRGSVSPREGAGLPAESALHDHPAQSSVTYEVHYSPSTREMHLWRTDFPFEILENWLIAHPDAILCEPSKTYDQSRLAELYAADIAYLYTDKVSN